MSDRTLPEERYGRAARRRLPRWAAVVGTGLIIVVGMAVTTNTYLEFDAPPVKGERLTYEARGDHSIELTFQVNRRDPSRPAVCAVRAQSIDAVEIGHKDVYIPPAEEDHAVTTVIRTSERAVNAEVVGCSLDVPPSLGPGGAEAG